MRLDIYRDEQLAATFIYGAAPRYYGDCGAEIATLIAATPVTHNWWTRESQERSARGGIDWWVARIISAPLARAGFRLCPVIARTGPLGGHHA